MTNPTPPAPNPTTNTNRLAILPGRHGCAPHDVRVLLRLHQRMERVTRSYTAIADAIVRRLDRTA